MNNNCLKIFVAILILSSSTFAVSGEPKVKKDGAMYSQIFDIPNSSGSIGYIVDARTQLCLLKWFSTGGSPTPPVLISCSDLSKRDEWKIILNWVK